MILEYRGSLDSIFSELCLASEKGRVQPKSAMASDIVSIGDSWLSYAVRKGLIEPIKDAEEHDWFRNLSEKWKVKTQILLISPLLLFSLYFHS